MINHYRQAFLLFVALLTFHHLAAQDKIVTAEGEVIEGKIETKDKHLVTFFRTGSDQKSTIPTLELRWIKQGDITYAVYPAENAAEEIELSASDFQTALREQEYGVLLHAFTLLEDAVFATGRADLTPVSRNRLIPLVRALAADKNVSYEITVHTDNTGTPAANLAVSERRANALKALFTANGLPPARTDVRGKGMTEPLYTEKEDQAKNRRVELRVKDIRDTEVLYAEEYVRVAVVEEITPEKEKEEEVVPQETVVTSSIPIAVKKRGNSYKGFSFTVGARADQILGGESNAWSSKEGVGLLRSLGGDLHLNYRLNRVLGVLLSAGFQESVALKEYVTDGVLQYSTRETLRQIPVQAGLRLYMLKNLYLQATGGGQHLQMTFTASGSDLFGDDSYTSSAMKLSYGGGIGYELLLGRFLIDISGQYNRLHSDGFYGSSAVMPTVGLRLGIGFDFKR